MIPSMALWIKIGLDNSAKAFSESLSGFHYFNTNSFAYIWS